MINILPPAARKGSPLFLYLSILLGVGMVVLAVLYGIRGSSLKKMKILEARSKTRLESALQSIERLQSQAGSSKEVEKLKAQLKSVGDELDRLKELLREEGKLPLTLAGLKLTGILQGEKGSLVIFNNRIFRLGDSIPGTEMEVLAIGEGAVIVGNAEKTTTLRLKKESKEENDIRKQPIYQSGPQGKSIKEMIVRYSHLIGLDPTISLSVAKVESDLNPEAISSKGARGVFQIIPSLAQSYGYSPEDLFDPHISIPLGIRILKGYLDYFGDLDLTLAAYNAGFGRVKRCGHQVPDIKETREYIKKVKRAMEKGYV